MFIFSATYGKSCGHLLRLCGLMHIVEEVFNVLETYYTVNLFEEIDYRYFCDFIKTKQLSTEISEKTVLAASRVNEYFINQKMNLAGYSDPQFSRVNVDQNKPSNYKLTNEDKLGKNIILIEGSSVSLTKFTLKKIGKSEEFEKACLKLQQNKLGKYESKFYKSEGDKKKCSKPSKVFIKCDFNKLNEDEKIDFINSLIFYEISIQQYLEKFNFLKSNDSGDDTSEVVQDDNRLKRSTYSTQFDKQDNQQKK